MDDDSDDDESPTTFFDDGLHADYYLQPALTAGPVLLDDGRYTVSIEATDVQGNPVQAPPLTTGIVDGITFENGYPELLVGLARIIPADIVTISDGDGSSSSPLPPDEEDSPTLPGGSSSFGAP